MCITFSEHLLSLAVESVRLHLLVELPASADIISATVSYLRMQVSP